MTVVGHIALLRRYPVKSLGGEDLSSAYFGANGLAGDRTFAVYSEDGGLGSGKTSRRFRKIDGLRDYRAVSREQDVAIVAPDGSTFVVGDPATDAMLSAAFERPLFLAEESSTRHHDDSDVHLVCSSSVQALEREVAGSGELVDPRRLRANLVLDTESPAFAEDAWTGRQLAVGDDLVLEVGPVMRRCVMVDGEEIGVRSGPPILKALGALNDVNLGLQARVVTEGVVSVGDEVRLLRGGGRG